MTPPTPQEAEIAGVAEPKPDLYELLRRFTIAAKGIHEVAEKFRAQRQTCPTCGQSTAHLQRAQGER
jgi:hypothetical protein